MTDVSNNVRAHRGDDIPLVYVVIPNFNGTKHLSYSLPSLFDTAYRNYRVVLVDNGSTDGSIDYVTREYENVFILRNTGKKCFAAGCNVGIRHALASGAAYVAIFNNDIRVLPEWLDLVLPVFSSAPDIGVVGFTEITRNREELFYSSSVSSATIVGRSVRHPPGCLFLCSAAAFNKVGLFDEDYFMYGEDNDLFFRLIAGGFRLLETNVPVWHYAEGSAQSKSKRLMATWLAYRNALRFSLKNESGIRVLRMLLSLANQGCNPFLNRPLDNSNIRRLRRYNPVVNVFLLTGSCIWNIWHIRSTLKARSLHHH